MDKTFTVRLPKETAAWLDEEAARTGLSKGQIVREQLEAAQQQTTQKPFMKLAGCVSGPRNLSQRKGYTRR